MSLIRALLLAVALIVALLVLGREWEKPWAESDVDLTSDYVSAKAVLAGASPYAPMYPAAARLGLRFAEQNLAPDQRNPHSPAHILLFVPLAYLEYDAALKVWLVVGSASFVVAVAAMLRWSGVQTDVAVAISLLVLAVPAAHDDLVWRQTSSFLLLAFVAAWRQLVSGRERICGILLGTAVALKLFPLFLVVPLIRLRRWIAVRWMMGIAAAVSLPSMLVVGSDETRTWLVAVIPANAAYWIGSPFNVSLFSLPFRVGSSTVWRPDAASLPDGGLLALALAGSALCVLAAAATEAELSGETFWSAMPWMVLASPLAWNHYMIFVFPLLVLILAPSSRDRLSLSPLFQIGAVLILSGGWGVLVHSGDDVSLGIILLESLPTLGLVLVGLSDMGRPWAVPTTTMDVLQARPAGRSGSV